MDFTFYADPDPIDGIVALDSGLLKRFVPSACRYWRHLIWQPNAVKVALERPGYDAIVYLASPYFLSTWVGAALARLRGIRVLFWGHGWLHAEPPGKAWLRRTYFALANKMLVYAPRAVKLGARAGYPAERIKVVYNSLDVAKADAVIARIEDGSLQGVEPAALFAHPDRPVVICTARLIDLCRFDLLIDAAAQLARRGRPVNVLLVGNGPERAALEAQAKALGVDVHFYGACYDEDVLGQLLYKADLTVSPGKIGLTAMHTLMYGTPALTHDNFDQQMPEVEALMADGVGALFSLEVPGDLADKIEAWFARPASRAETRALCREEIRRHWTPDVQVRQIVAAIQEV
ncbi:MAG TPA: glycosyltransferase family 4 protein [Novosphingobium sp.]|nr:glycosyltransferase family 4 protein [Novosphingobium sp.]